MKRIRQSLLRIFAGAMILAVFSCDSMEDKAGWTILVYMAADNGLSERASIEINQMEQAYLSDDNRVIVQVDRHHTAEQPGGLRYKVVHDNDMETIRSAVLQNLGEIDSADPGTLADFVAWGTRFFPAERYALIIWSHGSGWYRDGERDICRDDNCPGVDPHAMGVSNGDLRRAFADFPVSFDLVLFDACGMQSLEVIGEIAAKSRVIVGSQDLFPTAGYPFDEIFPLFGLGKSPAELGCDIVNTTLVSFQPGGSQYEGSTTPLVISAIDGQSCKAFQSALAKYTADNLVHSAETPFSTAVAGSYSLNGGDAKDVRELFGLVQQTSQNPQELADTGALLTAIDAMILESGSINLPGNTVGSANIWVPRNSTAFSNWRLPYDTMVFADTGWTNYLAGYFMVGR